MRSRKSFRTTKKWQSKNKGYNNYEYILYCFIKEAFDASENVSVTVSDSPVLFANIGEQAWKIERGDAYRAELHSALRLEQYPAIISKIL